MFGRTVHMIFITFLDPSENSLYSNGGLVHKTGQINLVTIYKKIIWQRITFNAWSLHIYLIENKVKCNNDCRAFELCIVFRSWVLMNLHPEWWGSVTSNNCGFGINLHWFSPQLTSFSDMLQKKSNVHKWTTF